MKMAGDTQIQSRSAEIGADFSNYQGSANLSFVVKNARYPVEKRFWDKVEKIDNPFLCWKWTGFIRGKEKPYGRISVGGKDYSAHRISYFLNFGIDPKELHVLHKCDNHRCVNPNHLFLGTNADNVADKVRKGRQARNECWNKGKETRFRIWDNPNCKLAESDFEKMKLLYETGSYTITELAAKFNTCKKTVSMGVRKLGGYVPSHYQVLSKEIVTEIRSKFKRRVYGYAKLAKEYGVNINTINSILNMKTWKHI